VKKCTFSLLHQKPFKNLLLFWPERCIIEADVFLPAWIGRPSDKTKGQHICWPLKINGKNDANYFAAVRRHREQTCIRWGNPLRIRVTVWMLGFHCRLVWRIEWLTLCPLIGFLPQMSHLAIDYHPSLKFQQKAVTQRRGHEEK
jgi:hypothetical protein